MLVRPSYSGRTEAGGLEGGDSIAAFAAFQPDLIIPKPLDPALLPIGLDG